MTRNYLTLCGVCEMTLLSKMLGNYLRRKTRGKTQLALCKEQEAPKACS